MPHAFLDSDVGSTVEVAFNLGDELGIGVVIPDGFQCISVTYDQGVGTLLVRGVKGGIFRFGHIGGIESGTGGFGAISL